MVTSYNFPLLIQLYYLMMSSLPLLLPLHLVTMYISLILYLLMNYIQFDLIIKILANELFPFDNIEEHIEINSRLYQKNIHCHSLDVSFLCFVLKTLFRVKYQDTLSMST